jgi:amino acid adenylation domain-containing protein
MLVSEFLERSAEKFPDKTALVCESGRFSFGSLEALANGLARGLLDAGLRKPDRVAVFLEPCPEAVVAIFAALKAGCIFVPINPQVKPKKLAHILKDCGAGCLVTDAGHYDEAASVLADVPGLTLTVISDDDSRPVERPSSLDFRLASYQDLVKSFSPRRPPPSSIDIDLASLIYTSGTTGVPKGVMLTHLNMVTAAESIIRYLENTPDDIIMNVLPLSFDYGLYQVLMAFKFGGTVLLEKSFLFPFRTIDLMIREKVTGFPIVPATAAVLFSLRNLDQLDFSSLRYITNTGQALPPVYIERLRNLFPRAKIYSMYGLTECKRVSYLPPEEIAGRPLSVGKPIPNTEATIVDEEGRKVERPGIVGELVVRGGHVMKGYWNLPEETDKVLKPGPWPGERILYTGDLFKMDDEGYLYFVSRKDDLIKVGGSRVSPREIENALLEMDDIEEAAVVGVEHKILGQAVKAFVVLKTGSTARVEDILRHCASRLENFMVPKSIEIRPSLPKSSHGKIDKKELK